MAKETPFPLVKIKGKYLHSPYNPIKEARKILAGEDFSQKTKLILFEPGLGYGAELILESYPHLKLLIVSPLNLVKTELAQDTRISLWTGNLSEGLEDFLLHNIHESDIFSLAYFPWPTSLRLLPEEGERSAKTIERVLNRLKANHYHVKGFSRKNFRNSLINYLTLEEVKVPKLKGKPVIVVASGPSLEDNLEEIKHKREGYFIISLPSAVSALKAWAIKPHMIVSTDPGYWAARHFRHFPEDIPVGISLNGMARLNKSPFPLFKQGNIPEESLMANWDLPSLPSTGSVALSLLEYLSRSGASSITFAGFDLAMRDIKSHASPHSFDNYLITMTGRFKSLHHIYFERANTMTLKKEGTLRYGHALSQYKEWLESRSYRVALYRLKTGTPPLKGVKEIDSLPEHKTTSFDWQSLALPVQEERRKNIHNHLKIWQQQALNMIQQASPLPTEERFCDFLYTLIPDEFIKLQKSLILRENIEENQKAAREGLNRMITEGEELCDRLSQAK
ncbi:MAG: DUF115 domain-containing protein [Spirochaetales bacterium]|nr:DUF115 domain-containing protein [Spirochaetales bacterium]